MRQRQTISDLIAIGGFDPSGGAGLLADTKVFSQFKISYRAACTAVTAQSSRRFLAWQPVSPRLFDKQLQTLTAPIWGVKIGMLATPDHARILLRWLKKVRPKTILWDPVFRASRGPALFEPLKLIPAIQKLFQTVHILTPNLQEARWLLGMTSSQCPSATELTRRLFHQGGKTKRLVVLTGGHPDRGQAKGTDLFYSGKRIRRLKTRERSLHPHGTGCTFGSALLAYLYLGKDAYTATRAAKRYVLNRLFDAPTP